jgi:hypothetical protein
LAKQASTRLSRHEARRFGLVVGTVFIVLGGLAWWRDRPLTAQVLGGIGTLLVLLGVIAPGVLSPVYRVWMGAATALSKLTTPILLALVYFGVLTPIGILRRIVGKGRVSPPAASDTFWVDRRGHRQRREHLERQF